MAYQGIGTGTTPNDNTGDSLFTGAVKINSNFSEIYNALGDGSTINLSKSRTITAGSGLSGGGDLSANITLNVGQGDGISVSADSIAVDNTVIRTTGGQTITGSFSATSNITNGGFDFILGNSDQIARGNSGASRALTKDTGSTLVLNYAGDFTGGVRIDSGVYAPIYYDINNSGYYLDASSTSVLNSINLLGTLNVNTGAFTGGDALIIQNGGDLKIYSSGNSGSARLYCDTNNVLNIGSNLTVDGILTSSVTTGTAPFTVNSTTKVTNLNADFLDGIDSSRVVFGDDETKTSINNNWNSTLSSGFYNQFGPDGTGTPTETWYHMICCRHPNSANNYQMQISGSIFDANDLYYRIINNNTPTSWYKIWHSNNHGNGSGLDADLLRNLSPSAANTPSTIVARDGSGNFSANNITATTFSGNGITPIGGIIMWSGTIASISSLTGWALCDGTNGTPDLRNRFIVGATDGGDNTYPGLAPNCVPGGSANAIVPYHNHSVTLTQPNGIGNFFNSFFVSRNRVAANNINPANDAIDAISSGGAGDPTYFFDNGSSSVGRGTLDYAGTYGNDTNANLPPYYALAFIMRTA